MKVPAPTRLNRGVTLLVVMMLATVVARAQAPAKNFNVLAQSATTGIPEFARQAGIQILVSEPLVRGKQVATVTGSHSIAEGLLILLKGTGLTASSEDGVTYTLAVRPSSVRDPPAAQAMTAPQGQPSEQEITGVTLAEVIVTANKRNQRLQDVPASITAETGATLEHRGATQLADIVQTTPGLTNAGTGGGNSTDLTIRGVTTGGLGLKQSTVALLFDDIPIDPAFSTQSATNLRTVDIERVEVLRGPQGTLFGSGSLSGAVRFITNKPDLEDYSGSAEVTGTGTDGGSVSGSGNLVLNAPIIQDKLAVRMVGYRFNDGGWVDDIRTRQSDVNGNHTSGGRVEIEGRPDNELTVTLTGAYQKSHDLGAGESLYTQPSGYGESDQVTNLRRSADLDVVSKLANAGVRYDLNSVSLFSSSTYIRRETVQLDDGGYYNDALGLAFGLPQLTGAAAPAVTNNNQDIFTQELRASSREGGPLKWTLGAFYLKANLEGGQVISSPALFNLIGVPHLGDLQSRGNQTEVSGFGETTYTLADKWDLTAGVRVSYTSLKSTTDSTGVLLVGSVNPDDVVSGVISQHSTSADPRFSLAYRADPDLTFYATVSRGHRVGGPNLTAGLGGPGIPTSYQSDSLWNYEAGVKSQLFDGRLQLSGDLYYIDWSDIQVALVKNNVNYVGNAGSAGIYGGEFEGMAKPVKWLDLGGSLSLSHGVLTEDVPNLTRVTGLIGVKSGELLPASPEAAVTLFSQGNFSVMKHDAYVRISDSYIGSEYTDFDRQGTHFGDYNTVELRAGVYLGRFEVVAFARNLTNSDGAQSASDQTYVGPVVANPQLAYRIRPRTVGLTVRASF
jgi:outer membrane receptor protein involved in Fe transport